MIIICWVLLELLLWFLYSRHRSIFQWLIMAMDESPELDQKALWKFTKKDMDRPVQWILRKNLPISILLHFDYSSNQLIKALVRHGNKFLFCMVPQWQDRKVIKHHGTYYRPLLD